MRYQMWLPSWDVMKAIWILITIAYVSDDSMRRRQGTGRPWHNDSIVVCSYVLPTAHSTTTIMMMTKAIASTHTTKMTGSTTKPTIFKSRTLFQTPRRRPSSVLQSTKGSNNKNDSSDGTLESVTISSASSLQQRPRSTGTAQQQQLLDWADRQNIQLSSNIQLQTDPVGIEASGYGWYVKKENSKVGNDGEILLSVPSSVAVVIESTSTTTSNTDDNTETLPWYVHMAVKLCQLDQQQQQQQQQQLGDYHPWIQSLPRTFDTPLHWSQEIQNELQYPYLQNSVERQRHEWQTYYDTYQQRQQQRLITYEQFVWGCECARSRAFAGSYSGGAYNPNLYLFTLLLITIYVGGNFGTLEQAANGAGVVFAATILKDFVLPKIFKVKRYIICPMIDMTNHNSRKAQGTVAFEYFSNSYSLSIKPNTVLQPNEQIYISYGTRSNDQLLQYYGFVESNNPHDVYVMPSIREWDIAALEVACGRKFRPGRLQHLDTAGLLGNSRITGSMSDDNSDDDDKGDKDSKKDGVVLSRSIGLDPAILQALRVLVSSDDEWISAGQSIGNFSVEHSRDNEQCARLVARTAIEMELSSKPTTVEDDVALLKQMNTMSRIMADSSTDERLALQFRIEKKRLLQETIELLT